MAAEKGTKYVLTFKPETKKTAKPKKAEPKAVKPKAEKPASRRLPTFYEDTPTTLARYAERANVPIFEVELLYNSIINDIALKATLPADELRGRALDHVNEHLFGLKSIRGGAATIRMDFVRQEKLY